MGTELSEKAIVDALARLVAEKVARMAIRDLQAMKIMMSGDDSPLQNTWEEICAQVQFQESISWEDYDHIVHDLIWARVNVLPEHERSALWLQTPQGFDWRWKEANEREPHPVDVGDIVQWLAQEHIYAAAGDWSNPRIRAYLDRSMRTD